MIVNAAWWRRSPRYGFISRHLTAVCWQEDGYFTEGRLGGVALAGQGRGVACCTRSRGTRRPADYSFQFVLYTRDVAPDPIRSPTRTPPGSRLPSLSLGR